MHVPLAARALPFAGLLFALSSAAHAQDDILIYGNSIIEDWVVDYLHDIIVESGRPAPNIVDLVGPDLTTAEYLLNQGLITSSLPAGETWEAMIVQGGTVEVTNILGFDPADFEANMVALAGAFYAHSPQGLFVGHETGADHPNSNRYPAWFANAAEWLAFSQTAYANAQAAIHATYPAAPLARIAPQGTVFANTAGYPNNVFTNDDHHHSVRGQILDAMLHYQALYGGSLEALDVDLTQSTPLTSRLLSQGVDQNAWNRLAGFADRSLRRGLRPHPGSDDDFQLRVSVVSPVVNLLVEQEAAAGDTLYLRPFSPLDSTETYQAVVYSQFLPTGTTPVAGTIPGTLFDPASARVQAVFPDLLGGSATMTIPPGLAGNSLWFQAVSRAPATSSAFPIVVSDGKVVHLQ